MLKNYIKIALRSLWKNRISSFINIISLAVGLSAAIVIGMMVYYEFTFDKFHPDGDRTYRVASVYQDSDGISYNTGIPVPLVEEVEQNLTGIEETAFISVVKPFNIIINEGDSPVLEPKFVIYTDQNYFKIFDYEWLAGNGKNQLLNPSEVVLTASRAKAYFPDSNPSQVIGRRLIYNDSINTTVTGVVADFEERTDLVFKEFISFTTQRMGMQMQPNWSNVNSSSQLLVKLERGVTAATFQKQLDQVASDREDLEAKQKYGETRGFYAQPFLDLHFDENLTGLDSTVAIADKNVITTLGIIAIFLLILGCVNFINLNTAQATQRAKEIGIRKTLGSSKFQLIKQFMSETFLLTLIAGLLSVFIAFWLIYIFSDFIKDGVNLSLLREPHFFIFLVFLIITVTLMAGFYPSFVLARFKPSRVLKGDQNADTGSNGLRKFLTIFQFTVAYVFVIATLLVGKQINFLLDKDLGFKTESVIYIDTPSHIEGVKSRELLAQKLKSVPQIGKVSLGGGTPVNVQYITPFTYKENYNEHTTDVNVVFGDSEFLQLYEIPLVAGRLPRNDTIKEVVINRTALSKLGFDNPQAALNKVVNPDQSPFMISGVMENFQNGSLKYEVSAMALMGDVYRKYFSQFTTIHAAIKPGSIEDMSTALKNIEEQFNEVYPDSNLTLNFMDDTVENFYNKERSLSKLLNWAMGLSLLVSCLGLLGLVIYNTERRVKEIGIRKVLGATVTQINVLLCKDFLWLVAIAFIIATPIAYWSVNEWLQNFVIKTEMSWWIFISSGLGMLTLAVIIMSFKTIKAATENPVDNLKIE